MKILNDEFIRIHGAPARNDDIIIDNWNISDESAGRIMNIFKNEFNKDVTKNELNEMINGPELFYEEYQRVKINDTTFQTHLYETTGQRLLGRTTRKFIKYRRAGRANEIAYIKKIIKISSHSVLRLSKVYTLLEIQNYDIIPDHPSELLHVKKSALNTNIHNFMPIIDIMDVKPFNIAAWPAGDAKS